MKSIAITALLLVSLQAHAINKCTQPDGKVAFQDAPCAGQGETIQVRPASGHSKPTMIEPGVANADESTPQPGKPQSEAQRIESNIAKSQHERRLRDLQERIVPSTARAIEVNREACEKEQMQFERNKYRYVQNLYGKTDAAQTASEQAAASARCDTKDRELRQKAERAKEECRTMGGCP